MLRLSGRYLYYIKFNKNDILEYNLRNIMLSAVFHPVLKALCMKMCVFYISKTIFS